MEWLDGALLPDLAEAGLSVARKNGKSGLVAAALHNLLDDPPCDYWRAAVLSVNQALSKELEKQMLEIAQASSIEIKHYKSPPPRILGKRGSMVSFLAADRGVGHALGLDLAIVDELGLMEERDRPLVEGMYSSVSGRDGRVWCLGIQATGPMFAEMEERAKEGGSSIFFRKYAAPNLDCDITDREAWAEANPGLGTIKGEKYMANAAARAKMNPAHFRRHDLNQPVEEASEILVSVQDWLKCEADEDALPPREGTCVVGFDPGRNRSMTAAAVLWESGRMEIRAALPDAPNLKARQDYDKVGILYEELIGAGTLKLYPGKVTPFTEFVEDLARDLEAWEVRAWATDSFKRVEMLEVIEDKLLLDWGRCVTRTGQSAAAISEDVACFRRAVDLREFASPRSKLVRHALGQCVVKTDERGLSKLVPRKDRSRYDAVSAALLALAANKIVPPGAQVWVGDPEDPRYAA